MNCPPQQQYENEIFCRERAIERLQRVNYQLKVSKARFSNWMKCRIAYAISYFYSDKYSACLNELSQVFIPADQYSSDILWGKEIRSLTCQQLSKEIESLCLIK